MAGRGAAAAYWERPLPAASSRRGASFGSGGGLRGASSGSGGGWRKVRQPPPGAALSRCGGPCSSSGARPSPSPLRPPDLRPLLLLRRAAPFLSSPAAGSVGPDPPSPARGQIRPAAAGATTCRPFPSSPPGGRTGGRRRRRRLTLPPVEGDMAPAAAASSGSGGGGLLVAAACGGRQGSSGGGASGGGGVAGPNFFYLLFIYFAVCPRHTPNYSIPVVHVRKRPLARETEQSGEDK